MTDQVKFSDAEKAYFESGGKVNPETGKSFDETPFEEAKPEGEENGTKAADAQPDKQPAAETDVDGDKEADKEEGDEEVEVVNKDGETRRKMIAYGAYEKQRREAKAAKESLSKMEQQLAYLTGVLANQKGGQPQQEQPQAVPDYRKEPEKWLEYVHSKIQETQQTTQQQQQMSQQQAELHRLNQTVLEAEQEFVNGDPDVGVEAHPDYMQALEFLNKAQKQELKLAGYEPAEIQQIMTARAQAVAIKAMQRQKSPAEAMYELAKHRGYKLAKPKVEESPVEKITRQAEGQKKAKTIAAMPGGESSGLTDEMLANMSPEEFQRLWNEGKAQKHIGFVA